jgi:membrane protein DedA with SNARE-associated domain
MDQMVVWLEQMLNAAKDQALQWTHDYGYHAVIPALLVDPAGVPWAWIFLMLLAGEADKSIPLMVAYGCAVMTAADHLFYWIGVKGGRPLVERFGQRWPKIAHSVRDAETAVEGKGIWMITIGRFLPLVGRYVGIGAGLANVPFGRFAVFDALGVAITVVGFGLAAHLVGARTINSPAFPYLIGGAFIGGTLFTTGFLFWQGWKAHRARAVPSSAPENVEEHEEVGTR